MLRQDTSSISADNSCNSRGAGRAVGVGRLRRIQTTTQSRTVGCMYSSTSCTLKWYLSSMYARKSGAPGYNTLSANTLDPTQRLGSMASKSLWYAVPRWSSMSKSMSLIDPVAIQSAACPTHTSTSASTPANSSKLLATKAFQASASHETTRPPPPRRRNRLVKTNAEYPTYVPNSATRSPGLTQNSSNRALRPPATLSHRCCCVKRSIASMTESRSFCLAWRRT
mmetsp:Transcript_26036/g.72773  ORF Transcript_26036/g.72773 Transcript_26036/m.72773 type:complete len:225 (+) Transcript_26036:215-889(+)